MLNTHLNVVQQIAILALQLGVIIFVAKFCGDLAKKLKMPSVLGELTAGILIGPYVLGGIPLPLHGLEHGLFGFSNTVQIAASEAVSVLNEATIQNVTFSMYHSSLYAVATVGSILLLFMSGLETDLRMFFRYSVVGTVVGIGGVVFSFLFGNLVGMWMLKTGFMDPRCLFLGILCTATSVGITARILSEKKKIDTPEGVTILAAAVIDDVLGIICLAIVMGIVGAIVGGEGIAWSKIGLIAAKCIGIWLGATVAGLLLARYIAKFLRLFKSPSVFAILAFGFALLLAGLFEQSGLAMIIGAYVMGLSLSKTDVSFAVQHALHPLYNFLVPVFFVVMGMLVDIRVFADVDVLKIGVIYSLLAVLAKIIGCAIPSLFMNFNMTGALRIGTGMVPRGEVALIIAGIGAGLMMKVDGQTVPILDSRLFGVAIIMTLATTVLAPPLLSFMLARKGKGVRREVKDHTIVHTSFKCPSDTIAEFMLKRLMESFENEGFFMSTLDKETGILQFRRDNLSFAMVMTDNEFVFESNPDEVIFIKTIMYETFVDLHQSLGKLRELAKPEEMQKDIFENNSSPHAAEENTQKKTPPPAPIVEKNIPASCICMDLKADTKEGVIRELVDLLEKQHLLLDKEMCIRDLLEREKVVSTCMQQGLALPHERTDGVDELVAAIGIKKEGYHFDSMDGEPSKVFVLCLSPKSSSGPHIQFIAGVAAVFSKKENMDAILNASSPEEVLDVFKSRK